MVEVEWPELEAEAESSEVRVVVGKEGKSSPNPRRPGVEGVELPSNRPSPEGDDEGEGEVPPNASNRSNTACSSLDMSLCSGSSIRSRPASDDDLAPTSGGTGKLSKLLDRFCS